MNTSEQILVVILSTVFAILLVLLVVIAIQVIRLVKAINRITEKAEHIIESAEHASDIFRNVSGPLALMRVINNVVQLVSKHSKR